MNKRIKGLIVACCSLGTMLLLPAAAWSEAVSETSTASSSGGQPLADSTLEELDQIVLNGKRFEQRLQESEQRFYAAYNRLNPNKDLAVTCDFWTFNPRPVGVGATRNKRNCVPVFYAKAVWDVSYVPVSPRHNSMSPLNAYASDYGSGYGPDGTFSNMGYSGASTLSSWHDDDNWSGGGSYMQPSTNLQAQLLYLSRRSEFEANVYKVMRSDPQLQALGMQFEDLIREGNETQRVATEARKLRVAMRLAQRKCPQPTSPRNLTKACKSG